MIQICTNITLKFEEKNVSEGNVFKFLNESMSLAYSVAFGSLS